MEATTTYTVAVSCVLQELAAMIQITPNTRKRAALERADAYIRENQQEIQSFREGGMRVSEILDLVLELT